MGFNLPILNRRRRYLTSAFTPASLFTAGESGYWLDPSDFTTMYQDSTGVTPVTAVGQPVGLLLDKSQGLVLGPELRSTGTLALIGTATAATYNTSTGAATATRVNGANLSGVTLTGIASPFVQVSFSVSGGSATGVRFRTAGLSGGTVVDISVGQSFTGFAPTTGGQISFTALSDGATATFTINSVREIPGNHATQPTAASRPILGREPFGGRRNLLTFTEQFDNAAWTKTNATVTANAAVAPDGTTTADALIENTANTVHFTSITAVPSLAAGAHTISVYLKANGRSWAAVGFSSNPVNGGAYFDLQNGVVGTRQANNTSASITSVGGGWYRCVVSAVCSAGNGIPEIYIAEADNDPIFAGNGTSGILIWGAQLETGSTATAYQRVTTAFDVTQAGVPDCYYLSFDGTDDWLVSPTITPGIDKAQVFAGVRKLSDTFLGVVVESSANIGVNNGAVGVYAPAADGTATYQLISKGTGLAVSASPAGFPAPTTNVLTGIGDIATDTAILRANGSQVASSATDQGTGNFLAYPLYVGRRGGASLPLNGRIYSMIVRFGPNLTAGQITQTENYVAGETGVYTLEQLNRFATLDASGVSYNAYGAADANSNNYFVSKTVLAADGTPYSVL